MNTIGIAASPSPTQSDRLRRSTVVVSGVDAGSGASADIPCNRQTNRGKFNADLHQRSVSVAGDRLSDHYAQTPFCLVSTIVHCSRFRTRDTVAIARWLVGKQLVLECPDAAQTSRITEVEAYDGPEDLACHAS
jgi:hypothetical protein